LPLRLYLGGRPFVVKFKDLFMQLPAESGRPRQCSLMVRPNRMGTPMKPDPNDPAAQLWVLGGAFLEHVVTVFDFDRSMLGFAPHPSDDKAKPIGQCLNCWAQTRSVLSWKKPEAFPWKPLAAVIPTVLVLLTLVPWCVRNNFQSLANNEPAELLSSDNSGE